MTALLPTYIDAAQKIAYGHEGISMSYKTLLLAVIKSLTIVINQSLTTGIIENS